MPRTVGHRRSGFIRLPICHLWLRENIRGSGSSFSTRVTYAAISQTWSPCEAARSAIRDGHICEPALVESLLKRGESSTRSCISPAESHRGQIDKGARRVRENKRGGTNCHAARCGAQGMGGEESLVERHRVHHNLD